VVVLVFHCKSFKQLVAVEAEFVAHALDRAAATFGCVAYGVGDMNNEAKWPKGTSVAAQREAVAAADVGKLPPSNSVGSREFSSHLCSAGYTTYPEIGTITTLKMRTQFQGQPAKEGDLTAVHKDFVILPSSEKQVVTVVGGRPPIASLASNLDLLMPSRQWPADHYTIFCVLNDDPPAAAAP
jgi:hypothetical protein